MARSVCRRYRLQIRLGAIAATGMAAGFLAVTLVPAAWAGAVGGLATVVVTAVALGVQAEWSRHVDVVRGLPSGLQISSAHGRFPRVRDLADPIAVGVHPAAPLKVGGVLNRVPPYIPRDIEPELHTALRDNDFIILVGESAAGKTRAAFEAMRRLYGDYRFAAPASRDVFPALLEVMTETADCVLWLDDLERFLGASGLTLSTLHLMLSRRVRIIVLATIRSHEYDRFRDRAEKEVLDREAWRECRAVLRQAQIIYLERRWSAGEIDRARSQAADRRLAHALASADRFGVAEMLAAGPELAQAWRDAWVPGHHPRGAALVAAAAAARRAGYHRPLSVAVLERMHPAFLDERGGPELHPEPFADALSWASSPTFPNGANSLLIGSAERGYLAFDYLLDLPQPCGMPETSWMALVEGATGPDAYLLAENAVQADRYDRALPAYRRAAQEGYSPAEAVLAELGVPIRAAPESLSRARQHHRRTRDEYGPDHENTFLAELSVVALSIGNGLFGDALSLAGSIVRRGEKVLGHDHRIVLAAQFSGAYCVFKLGPIEDGIARLEAAASRAEQVLGKQDSATASRRITLVEVLAEAGNVSSARKRLSTLQADYSAREPGNYIATLLAEAAHKVNVD